MAHVGPTLSDRVFRGTGRMRGAAPSAGKVARALGVALIVFSLQCAATSFQREVSRCLRISCVAVLVALTPLYRFHNVQFIVRSYHSSGVKFDKMVQKNLPNDVPIMKNSTRSKVNWCFFRNHMLKPMNLLEKEFGYTEQVNVELGDDWDLIFGGYPHCGEHSDRPTPMNKFDWKMEHGLNAYMARMGWDKLKPHQVWFPCMGCKSSYCNKRDLCLLTRKIDPKSCYLLPDDLAPLLEEMIHKQKEAETSGKQYLWVVKQDSAVTHKHLGTGVRFIMSKEELPTIQEQMSGEYLVQPLVHHKMGLGEYQRRHELRMYVGVTSTTPLRVYAYSAGIVGRFANAAVNNTNPLDVCSIDMHSDRHVSQLGCQIHPKYSGIQHINEMAEELGLTQQDLQSFVGRTNRLLAMVLLSANPDIQDHIVNKGIAISGAACFSFLRMDFAMTEDLETFIYEINEFPFANEKGFFGTIQESAYREFFHLMGLDQPPMSASQRMKYEMANLGKWTPLIIDDEVYLPGSSS